ncbi:MAG: polysaccharide deacetylase family protein [Coriobacteriia bacterium]|nr:polysaccharide deacetylase family protein [Coriobacteriia bacterium]
MKSPWSIPFTLSVCALALAAAFAPTAALAAPVPGMIETSLTVAAPSAIPAKASFTATATLTDAVGAPLSGMRVMIEKVTISGVSTIATETTDSHGRVTATLSPVNAVTLRARYSGDADYVPALSTEVVIKPRVVLGQPWTHQDFAYPGELLPARGSLWPKHGVTTGTTKIVCQKYEKGQWVTKVTYSARTSATTSASKYSGTFRLPSAGKWRVRAMHEDKAHARSLGTPRTIIVTEWRTRYIGARIGTFKTTRKWVAITIDDGPQSATFKTLDVLDKYGAKGTFFFIGNLLKSRASHGKSAYDRGHEVANHTLSHNMLNKGYTPAYNSVNGAKSIIKSATGGFAPLWVRGMGGSVNTAGIKAVNKTNEFYVNWSVTAADTSPRHYTSNQIYHRIVDHIGPGDVILMHQTHPESVAALPRICATLKARGYKMVTVSKLASVSKPY